MAREYPRFLFSKSINTKHPGNYLTHTLEPRVIASIQKINNQWQIVPLPNEPLSTALLLDMQMWLKAQIQLRTIDLI
jgi:hypothetical protein